MTESKDSIEITPEMKALRQKIHDSIGSPEMCPHMRMKDECEFCAAKEWNGMKIALASMGSIAESTQLRVSELEDALDLNRDEFARIHAIASGGELLSEEAREVKGICERARERTWQLVPMIEQLEAANARIQTLADALSSLIYTAERTAELITSASDRYDIDVAIESAKEILKK
jgi:hypothetical protein